MRNMVTNAEKVKVLRMLQFCVAHGVRGEWKVNMIGDMALEILGVSEKGDSHLGEVIPELDKWYEEFDKSDHLRGSVVNKDEWAVTEALKDVSNQKVSVTQTTDLYEAVNEIKERLEHLMERQRGYEKDLHELNLKLQGHDN